MQNAPFTKAIKEKLFDLLKHHPKLGKCKEYEKSNSKNARNTKRQNLKPVKNDRSGLLVLIDAITDGIHKRLGNTMGKEKVIASSFLLPKYKDTWTEDNFQLQKGKS